MPVSTIPALIDALVEQATEALPDVNVFDGYGVTNDPGDYLMVGVDDPDSTTAASSVAGTQSMATMGTPRSRDEQFTVTCAAYSWNGDGDQKAARDGAAASVEAVAQLLRTDPTMGVGQPGRVVCQIDSYNLSQNANEQGCDALIIFTVANKARI